MAAIRFSCSAGADNDRGSHTAEADVDALIVERAAVGVSAGRPPPRRIT
jgi:hypothetical protein